MAESLITEERYFFIYTAALSVKDAGKMSKNKYERKCRECEKDLEQL